jgi:hypothetical protein
VQKISNRRADLERAGLPDSEITDNVERAIAAARERAREELERPVAAMIRARPLAKPELVLEASMEAIDLAFSESPRAAALSIIRKFPRANT